MPHIQIPIPDHVDAEQKEAMTAWLTQQVEEMTQPPVETEPDEAWRAEVSRRIQRGLDDIQAGRLVDAETALNRLADKHGLARPR